MPRTCPRTALQPLGVSRIVCDLGLISGCESFRRPAQYNGKSATCSDVHTCVTTYLQSMTNMHKKNKRVLYGLLYLEQ